MNATAMRKGRERAQRQRRRDAIRLVRQYRQWLQSGCDRRLMPERVPTNAEFKIAREAER